MKRGTFRSALILLGLIALGCRGRDDLPTPPAPPDLTKRVVPNQHLAEIASPAGKLYALAGLQLLDRLAASRLERMLAEESKRIVVFDSDVVWEKPVRELADIVERRDMGTQFRRMRDEVEAHYAKSR